MSTIQHILEAHSFMHKLVKNFYMAALIFDLFQQVLPHKIRPPLQMNIYEPFYYLIVTHKSKHR